MPQFFAARPPAQLVLRLSAPLRLSSLPPASLNVAQPQHTHTRAHNNKTTTPPACAPQLPIGAAAEPRRAARGAPRHRRGRVPPRAPRPRARGVRAVSARCFRCAVSPCRGEGPCVFAAASVSGVSSSHNDRHPSCIASPAAIQPPPSTTTTTTTIINIKSNQIKTASWSSSRGAPTRSSASRPSTSTAPTAAAATAAVTAAAARASRASRARSSCWRAPLAPTRRTPACWPRSGTFCCCGCAFLFIAAHGVRGRFLRAGRAQRADAVLQAVLLRVRATPPRATGWRRLTTANNQREQSSFPQKQTTHQPPGRPRARRAARRRCARARRHRRAARRRRGAARARRARARAAAGRGALVRRGAAGRRALAAASARPGADVHAARRVDQRGDGA